MVTKIEHKIVPMSLDHNDGLVAVAESGADRIVVFDISGGTLLRPNSMSVKQIEGALRKRNALPPGRRLKRSQLVTILQNWIAANTKKSKELNDNMAIVNSNVVLRRPTAVSFKDNPNDLFVGCMNGIIHCLALASDGIEVSGTAVLSDETNVPVSGLTCFGQNIYISSPCPKNGGIFTFKEGQSPNLEKLLDNNSVGCSTAHGICVQETSGQLVFTDIGEKQIKLLNVETREVKVLVGTGLPGNQDGSLGIACFVQPTGLCTENKSVFVVDSGAGVLKLMTSTLPLKELLSKLSILLRTFGVHNEECERFNLQSGILQIKSVKDFLHKCTDDARHFGLFSGQPCGPQGTMSSQTMSDVDRLIYGLESLQTILSEVNEEYTANVNLHSLLTILVENLFAEMRGGATETPQVLDFARRFSSATREMMKRLTSCSFNYYTSRNSYYSRPRCVTDFGTLPPMPKPATTHKLSSTAIEEMRKWRKQYGQSVRQQTVRNMSTKDKAGTLPINVYEEEPRKSDQVTMFDFFQLEKENHEISTNNSGSVNASVLGEKGDYAAVRRGYAPRELHNASSPFFLVKLQERIFKDGPVKRYNCSWFSEDLIPFHFSDSGNEGSGVISEGILQYKIQCEEVEEGIVRVDEDLYERTLLLALDEGDTTTATERDLLVEEENKRPSNDPPSRRSQRERRQTVDNDFFYL